MKKEREKTTMNRREFLRTSAFASLFAAGGGRMFGGGSIKWDPVKETSDNAAINARADIRRYNGWQLG